ncbi:MAG: META domain-containing protein [Burkholderiaceae bacterium]|nr:META domain-containing protein [Burkholderiaceae bacterium]
MQWTRTGTTCCAALLLVGQFACTSTPTQGLLKPPDAVEKKSHAVAVTPNLLAATSWTAFAIDGVAEVLSPKPRLRWDLSQRFSGTGGCNAFGGASVVGLDSLRLGPLAATGKACVTLPGAQEDMFFRALELTRKARLEGEQLVFLDASGKPLLRFLPGN